MLMEVLAQAQSTGTDYNNNFDLSLQRQTSCAVNARRYLILQDNYHQGKDWTGEDSTYEAVLKE